MRNSNKLLAIDLFCGLGGWAEGFLAEGWRVIGFDIERHVYAMPELEAIDHGNKDHGNKNTKPVNGRGWTQGCAVALGLEGEARKPLCLDQYPGDLVLQDVLTIDGAQFRDATVIVASPPCQEYSYMAMPWKRAKQIARALRGRDSFPGDEDGEDRYSGSRSIRELNELFNACFRIQREASEAAGRYIPMVVENVCGAQAWVGPAKARYGSYYLWGDIGIAGGNIICGNRRELLRSLNRRMKYQGSTQRLWKDREVHRLNDGVKTGTRLREDGTWSHSFADTQMKGVPGQGSLFGTNRNDPRDIRKNSGGSWFAVTSEGCKGSSSAWFDQNHCQFGSRTDARKAASAQIAKIPFPLARFIARSFKP